MMIGKMALVALLTGTAVISLAFGGEKDMKLETFTKIQVNAPVDLDVSVGEKPFFTLKGRDEDIEKLIIEVKGDELVIEKKKNTSPIRELNITLGLKNLTKFTINGSSDVKIKGVNADRFDLGINGSGDVDMTGKSDALTVKINGSGDVSSGQFDTKMAKAEIRGAGDVSLSGKCQELHVDISGSGDFAGQKMTCDRVDARISGSGDAIFFARKAVDIRSSGNSDVQVYGNPKSIKNKSSGSSELIVYEDK